MQVIAAGRDLERVAVLGHSCEYRLRDGSTELYSVTTSTSRSVQATFESKDGTDGTVPTDLRRQGLHAAGSRHRLELGTAAPPHYGVHIL